MSTHGCQGSGDGGAALPAALPFSLPGPSRLSWELGSRVVGDDESELLAEWESPDVSWTLSVFGVTTNTVVLRVRTPVGRERFYGAARADLDAALASLDAAADWQRLE